MTVEQVNAVNAKVQETMDFGRHQVSLDQAEELASTMYAAIAAAGGTANEIGSTRLLLGLPSAFSDQDGKDIVVKFIPEKNCTFAVYKTKDEKTAGFVCSVSYPIMATHPTKGQLEGIVVLEKAERDGLRKVPNWKTRDYQVEVNVGTDSYKTVRATNIRFKGSALKKIGSSPITTEQIASQLGETVAAPAAPATPANPAPPAGGGLSFN